jgi:recombination protein RecR
MDTRHALIELLRSLPGIGPRQAARFAAFLRFKDKGFAKRLADTLLALHDDVRLCAACSAMHANVGSDLCHICRADREPRLLIISNDADRDAIERTGAYKGHYYILGGTVPILEENPGSRIRLTGLKDRLTQLDPIKLEEVIFAFSANPEGDNTESFIRTSIEEWYPEDKRPKLTRLARGISTGTELEYADSDTIEAALRRRG